MKSKPWFVWFSVLAFIAIWADTSRKILHSKNKFFDFANDSMRLNIWFSALWNAFSSLLGLIISVILLGVVFSYLSLAFPFITKALVVVLNLTLYLLGVFITYRHIEWRKKNLVKISGELLPDTEKDEMHRVEK